jgi:predicted HTH transcriptional regulator
MRDFLRYIHGVAVRFVRGFRYSQAVRMDLQALKVLVRKGEGKTLEFKLKSTHPEKIVREIVAFANSEGGLLMVGVGDDKSISGLKFVEEDEYMLVRAIEKYCFPAIPYHIERVAVTDEREVLVLVVQKSAHGPHFVVHDFVNNTGKVYVRVEDKSVQASKEMRQVLKGVAKRRNIRFQYGEKERILMQYLSRHPRITVEEFSRAANISREIASRTLVLLVLANVIRIYPQEVQDYFAAMSL